MEASATKIAPDKLRRVSQSHINWYSHNARRCYQWYVTYQEPIRRDKGYIMINNNNNGSYIARYKYTLLSKCAHNLYINGVEIF